MSIMLGMPALPSRAPVTAEPGGTGARPLVILVYPKIDHEKNYVYFWMPFALLTLAKPLMESGMVDVVLFDGNQQDSAAWEQLLDEELERTVCIGVSIMTGGGQIGHALDLVASAKARAHCPPVVFGGPHVNVLAEQTAAHPLVDAVLQGPGQNSMTAYVASLLGRTRRRDVPGLIAHRCGQTLKGPVNPPRTGAMGAYRGISSTSPATSVTTPRSQPAP